MKTEIHSLVRENIDKQIRRSRNTDAMQGLIPNHQIALQIWSPVALQIYKRLIV